MVIHVYNTLTRTKEQFTPLQQNHVRFFVCGPTVYDYIHIGNARTLVQMDMIARYLRYKGYVVLFVENITDIDDKIIRRAQEEGIPWNRVSEKYAQAFLEDVHALHITAVTKFAKATDYIPEIISQVQRLLEKGFAYKISDGYYFDLQAFPQYGKLAKRTVLEGEDAVSRIDENAEKRSKADFCLWKFRKEGEPFWPSELGEGRPGWHIEDTAITEKELGEQYDMHGGGMDLIFPHHEAEIAQMEALSGKEPFVKYWLHVGFLTVDGERMGKSKGNFHTVKDILAKGYHPFSLRYLLLSTHYRQQLNFTFESLLAAENVIERFKNFYDLLKEHATSAKNTIPNNPDVGQLIQTARELFEHALDDDCNISPALAGIFEFMKQINTLHAENNLSVENAHYCLQFLERIDTVLGVFIKDDGIIPEDIFALVKERDFARKLKDWKKADLLRLQIKETGFEAFDTPEGTKVKRMWSFKK